MWLWPSCFYICKQTLTCTRGMEGGREEGRKEEKPIGTQGYKCIKLNIISKQKWSQIYAVISTDFLKYFCFCFLSSGSSLAIAMFPSGNIY